MLFYVIEKKDAHCGIVHFGWCFVLPWWLPQSENSNHDRKGRYENRGPVCICFFDNERNHLVFGASGFPWTVAICNVEVAACSWVKLAPCVTKSRTSRVLDRRRRLAPLIGFIGLKSKSFTSNLRLMVSWPLFATTFGFILSQHRSCKRFYLLRQFRVVTLGWRPFVTQPTLNEFGLFVNI